MTLKIISGVGIPYRFESIYIKKSFGTFWASLLSFYVIWNFMSNNESLDYVESLGLLCKKM